METIKKIHLHSSNETLYIVCGFGEIESNPYFSCTGTLAKGIRKEETYKKLPDGALICCGCIHDIILDVSPEHADIISLQLSDINGVPMYAFENGYYFYGENKIDVLAKHLRISIENATKLANELNELKSTELKKIKFLQFILDQKDRWKAEADAVMNKYFN